MSNPIYEIFPEHFFPLGFTIWGHAMGFHCRDGMISGLAIAGYSWLQFCGFLSVTITYYYIILHLITESYIPPKYEISNESPEECTSNWGYVFRTGGGIILSVSCGKTESSLHLPKPDRIFATGNRCVFVLVFFWAVTFPWNEEMCCLGKKHVPYDNQTWYLKLPHLI